MLSHPPKLFLHYYVNLGTGMSVSFVRTPGEGGGGVNLFCNSGLHNIFQYAKPVWIVDWNAEMENPVFVKNISIETRGCVIPAISKRQLASRPGKSTGTISIDRGCERTDVLKVFVKLPEELCFDFEFVSFALPGLVGKP